MTDDAPDDCREGPDARQESPKTGPSDDNEADWQWVGAGKRGQTPERDRIPIDLSGSSAEDDADESADDADDPYAPEPSSTPIERGIPSLENAVFVVLGALAMILVIVRLVSIPF
jgi:hypothetical protein